MECNLASSNMAGYDFEIINALLIWFSGPDCRICHDLKPKIATLIAESFPRITLQEVNCSLSHETAAQYQVFIIPTLLIFFDGAEFIRKSRNCRFNGLMQHIILNDQFMGIM
ncbi:thioredoxin family protein [Candidatus Vondammii sp. HM_W22]|uniref:thioredoxin family protein n=1 Tax=Candidatus Vondammii sp. HM_W22 TaxID=2687299 RepID=UPI001F12D3BE|nr:thioredoxin family protein [Candidatus Vondammii sp. HM_W22]